MALKTEYVAVGNRLIPRETAPLVLEQMLGDRYACDSILLNPSSPPETFIEQLLDRCRQTGLAHDFTVSGISEMLEKFVSTNAPSHQQVRIALYKGKKNLFLIGFDDFRY